MSNVVAFNRIPGKDYIGIVAKYGGPHTVPVECITYIGVIAGTNNEWEVRYRSVATDQLVVVPSNAADAILLIIRLAREHGIFLNNRRKENE